MRKVVIFSIIIGLYGCDRESEGLAKLKALCEKDAGVIIYKTVEAEGYFDAYTDCHHCWQDLIKSNYQFYEFCTNENRNSLVYAIPEAGCYRLYKEKNINNNCHIKVNEKINEKSVEPYIGFRKNNCIAIEKIEKPRSSYKFRINENKLIDNKEDFLIRYEFFIEDKSSNKLLSKQIDYRYFTRNKKLPSYGCQHVIENFLRYSIGEFLTKTINPKIN